MTEGAGGGRSGRAMPRVYLAGPEVFLPDAKAIGAEKVALCARYGLDGAFPLDAGLDLAGLPPVEAGLRISAANEGLMRSCDLAIANLTPFRGPSADAGTVFEVGFMRALGRPVLGYATVDRPYRDRVADHFDGATTLRNGVPHDPRDCEIEDFGMADNLMIIGALVGQRLVVVEAPPDRRYRDLAAFARCLELARHTIG